MVVIYITTTALERGTARIIFLNMHGSTIRDPPLSLMRTIEVPVLNGRIQVEHRDFLELKIYTKDGNIYWSNDLLN